MRCRARLQVYGWLGLSALLAACQPDAAPTNTVAVYRPTPADAAVSDSDKDAGAAVRPAALRLPPADTTIALGPGDTHVLRLSASAQLGRLDVFVHMDTTASMGEEIDTLQRELLTTVVPHLAGQVPDVAFGVGRFEDFPVPPFGDPGVGGRADVPFSLLTAITQDSSAIRAAVFSLDNPLGLGGDRHEAGAEALFQIATGAGYRSGDRTYIDTFEPTPSMPGRRGGVGFRDHSLPVILHITDAPSHAPSDYGISLPGTRSYEQAVTALQELGARVISIVSSDCSAVDCTTEDPASAAALGLVRAELLPVALATHALLPADVPCATGLDGGENPRFAGACPAVFDIRGDGAGLSAALVDSTVALLSGLSFDTVRAVASSDPLSFVEAIVPIAVEQAPGQPALELADRRPLGAPDGVYDTVENVHRGAELEFAVRLANRHVAPLSIPQFFRIQVQVLGDDLVLREALLRIEVPARPVTDSPAQDDNPQDIDAGMTSEEDASRGQDADAGGG